MQAVFVDENDSVKTRWFCPRFNQRLVDLYKSESLSFVSSGVASARSWRERETRIRPLFGKILRKSRPTKRSTTSPWGAP